MSPTRDDVIDFIYAEARMLDEGRYSEWLDLWLEDGVYWMPLTTGRRTRTCDLTALRGQFQLRLRVERLNGERTFSQKPKSRCHHVIQAPSWTSSIRMEGGSRPVPQCTTWRLA